jgi:hypothetical protein
MSLTRQSSSKIHSFFNRLTRPFVMIDTTAFVNDPNFKKFVELFFGEGTKITYRQEWVHNFGDEPAIKILLIHTPTMADDKANAILQEFVKVMDEMKDYPINLIIDTTLQSQEQYMETELEIKGEEASIESETK